MDLGFNRPHALYTTSPDRGLRKVMRCYWAQASTRARAGWLKENVECVLFNTYVFSLLHVFSLEENANANALATECH